MPKIGSAMGDDNLLLRARISRHAWERFVTRWDGERPPCYRAELQALLAKATEEFLGYGTAIRILNNDFKPARYFTAHNWRFVTDEDVTKILTVERVYYGPKKPIKKLRSKKRHSKQ